MTEPNFWNGREHMKHITKCLMTQISELYISQESLEARVKRPKQVEARIMKLMNKQGTELENILKEVSELNSKFSKIMYGD